MARVLGNSGAPRWYDCDRGRFQEYLDHLLSCGATAAEIVLHNGEADEFTSRVHVIRPDWEHVITEYRNRGLSLTVHGPLTPEFSPKRWRDEPDVTISRYRSILQQVAELAVDQNGTTLILHAVADPSATLAENEHTTAAFLATIAGELDRWTDNVMVAIELRAYREARATAAATTRDSVLRVVDQSSHPNVAICWDVAHDLESRIAFGEPWDEPDDVFLRRVRHIHLHDLGPNEEPHYPPIVGRVPLESALLKLEDVPAVMEVRWRMAERLGDPWDVLRQSYKAIQARSRSYTSSSSSTRPSQDRS
jgi:sugar phosphate isomerase/epimerase